MKHTFAPPTDSLFNLIGQIDMPTESDDWSIDFPGIDEQVAEAIVDAVKTLGLASDAIVADPEVFMTLHLDIDTVIALHEALTRADSSSEERTILTGLSDAVEEWLAGRVAP